MLDVPLAPGLDEDLATIQIRRAGRGENGRLGLADPCHVRSGSNQQLEDLRLHGLVAGRAPIVADEIDCPGSQTRRIIAALCIDVDVHSGTHAEHLAYRRNRGLDVPRRRPKHAELVQDIVPVRQAVGRRDAERTHESPNILPF